MRRGEEESMRESELVRALLERLRDMSAFDPRRKIVSVRVRLGIGRAAPERFRAAFERVTRGTPAEAARLEMEIIPMTFRCTLCHHIFRSDEALGECPRCGALGGEVLGGQEFALVDVRVKDPEGAAVNSLNAWRS
jgi:hydrogenase nickel incorporation protein HypA/HybF